MLHHIVSALGCDLHGKWFWLKFREADGWSIASRIDTRFVR